MKNLREIAKKANVISELMENREKMQVSDIIRKYPNGITLVNVDIASSNEDTYPIFTFKEEPNMFFTGGLVLMKIVDAWLEEYDGDITTLSEDLSKENIMIKMSESKTKNGRNLTKVEIL